MVTLAVTATKYSVMTLSHSCNLVFTVTLQCYITLLVSVPALPFIAGVLGQYGNFPDANSLHSHPAGAKENLFPCWQIIAIQLFDNKLLFIII